MIKASDELQKGNYTDSAFDSIAAFKTVILSVKSSIVGQMQPRVILNHNEQEFLDVNMTINDLEEIRTLLMYSIIGLDFKSFTKFNRMTRATFIGLIEGGRYHSSIGREPYSQSEAEFVLDFVTNSVIRIESLVGDISNPFHI